MKGFGVNLDASFSLRKIVEIYKLRSKVCCRTGRASTDVKELQQEKTHIGGIQGKFLGVLLESTVGQIVCLSGVPPTRTLLAHSPGPNLHIGRAGATMPCRGVHAP
eukprot:scaffold77956_cov16-Tisochrysis_lutea.AAC.1